MVSHSSSPRLTPTLPRPTRGQIVWWVVGGVVAVAAFASVAFNSGGDSGESTDGAGTVTPFPVASGQLDETLPLAA